MDDYLVTGFDGFGKFGIEGFAGFLAGILCWFVEQDAPAASGWIWSSIFLILCSKVMLFS